MVFLLFLLFLRQKYPQPNLLNAGEKSDGGQDPVAANQTTIKAGIPLAHERKNRHTLLHNNLHCV